MILVDTSVWVDHMRSSEAELIAQLNAGNVLVHPMVIGELACGTMRDRYKKLSEWLSLPRIDVLRNEEVLALIESHGLMGNGIGFIDAHLLCATLRDGEARLWTRDARLKRVSEAWGVAFAETP